MILSKRLLEDRNLRIPFAFFDFDGTLTKSDSLMPFLRYLSGYHYYGKLLQCSPTLLAYFLKLLPNDKAKESVLKRFIGQMPVEVVQNTALDFSKNILPQYLSHQGMQYLHQHQQQKHYCILVSASPELYLIDWAKQHRFDGLLGTQLEIVDQKFTGRIQGANCFGEEKVKRIEAEYGAHCWENSFAYSDSHHDLPMLNRATHSFLI